MDKKKLIIIITVVVSLVLLIATFWGYSKYSENKRIDAEKKEIITVTNDFAEAWYNYTKQTSPVYLASIKPYMTDSFFYATKYINTSRPQDFEGQEPMSSTIKETKIIAYDELEATVNVIISSREGTAKTVEQNVEILLEKVDKSWLVNQIK